MDPHFAHVSELSYEDKFWESATNCRDCERFLTKWEIVSIRPHPPRFKHKASYAHLQDSISRGCRLCEILKEAWLDRAAGAFNLHVNQIVQRLADLDEDDGDDITFWIDFCDVEKDCLVEWPVFDEILYTGPSLQRSVFVSLRVHFALAEGRLELGRFGGRVIPEHVDLTLCHQWMSDCSESHPNCPNICEQELPARIIDIGPADGSPRLKLVATAGEKAPYAALSHCWGQREPPVTTSANLENRFRGIDWKVLPKTFQDAVQVVRALGLQYLWIDSLCIIQDDLVDWHNQCPQMVSTYSNAAITIAVAAAKDAHEGFLHAREPKDSSHLIYVKDPEPWSGVATIAVTPLITSPAGKGIRCFQSPPVLASRAWAFQERLLSPRILYFGSEQAYFECNSGLACESFQYPTAGLLMPHNGAPKDILSLDQTDLLNAWYGLVQDYTLCLLRYGSDKLPALAGLANLIQQWLGDEYCAGLWRNDLVRGLCWVRRDWRTHVGPKLKHAFEARSTIPAQVEPPSWSWASCDYPIHNCEELTENCEIQLLDVVIESGSASVFGRVSKGELIMRGKLKTGMVSQTQSRALLQDPENNRFKVSGVFLDSSKALLKKEITCLLMWKNNKQSLLTERNIWRALLLEQIPTASDLLTFRRVGMAFAMETDWVFLAQLSALHEWFETGSQKTIRII